MTWLSQKTPHWSVVFALLGITFAWGVSFPVVQWAVRDIGVYSFLTFRFLLAAGLVWVLFWRRIRRAPAPTMRIGCGLGVFAFAAFAAQAEGLRWTTASNSALITGLYLFLIPLVQWGWRRKIIGHTVWSGACCAFIGLYLLTSYSWNGLNRGDLLTLLAAIMYAGHILATEYAAHAYPIAALAAWQLLGMSVLSGLVATGLHQWPTQIARSTWEAIGFTAVICSALAMIVQTWAQRHIPAERIGIICSLEGLFGLLAGIVLGHEHLTLLATAGATLMIAGTTLAEVGPQIGK